MANLFTLLIIIAIVFIIYTIIGRKQKELSEKERIQRERFLKETQSILEMTPIKPDESPTMPTQIDNNDYVMRISDYFTSKGYTITESAKTMGIDLIGIKENELLLIRCERHLKEVKIGDLKEFIADCTIYADTHPILNTKKIVRYFATQRAITEEAQHFLRNHSSTLQLTEL